MQLEFEITNQQLQRKDKTIIVNETVNHVTCQFTFKTTDWQGVTKYAIFKNETHKGVCVELGDTCVCECNVPGKVMKHDFFRVTLFGIKDDERITTNEKTILLDRSGFTCDLEPADPNESGDIFSTN